MYEYRATVLAVVDGDTIKADVDLGFNTKSFQILRLAGINAPEKNTEAGKMAALWLADRLPMGTVVTIRTQKDRREKYGRYLAEVMLGAGEVTLNEMMVANGLAKRYDGGKR